jgi:D-arginine dehydrogenase
MHKSSKIAIIGAGFAGAATSYFLHRAGLTDCVVLEAEELPGMRSSGLNAALGRQIIANPTFRALAMAGMQFLRHPPADFATTPLIDDRGSVLLFSADDRAKADDLVAATQRDGLPVSIWDSKHLHAQFPNLREVATALHTPSDGLIDIHALLYGFLQPSRHRNQLITTARVTGIIRENNHWRISTTAGTWDADIIVNAAGAWAARIAELAGAESIPFQVRRRHLFVSAPTDLLDPHAPFVWDVSHGYYFRPESGGIMLSACDESLTNPEDAFQTAPDVHALLLEKLQRYCPRFADLPIARTWAGARTFAPQDQPLLRWDACAPQFFWVAGLGGHGATSSASIGQRAAQLIYEKRRSRG